MQKISLLILGSLLMTTPFIPATAEDTESTLDYIENTSSGVYKIHGKNISDPTLVNLYIDNKKVDVSDIAFTKDGMTVKNFSPLSGTFMIERMKADYGSGNVANYISDKKTESIKTRKTDIL